MIKIKPFRALRPLPEKSAEIICPPYDVIDTEEARKQAEGRPHSFLRVIRSELEFPPGTNPYGDEIYERAQSNLNRLIEEKLLIEDDAPALYIYQLQVGDHTQTGLVARYSVDDYLNDKIKKHELTRKDKEEDRTRHIDQLSANTGMVFLTLRSKNAPGIAAFLSDAITGVEPLYDVVREDGVRHKIFQLTDESQIKAITAEYAKLEALYIADGHHRAASAARAGQRRRDKAGNYSGDEDFNWFLAVSFPDEQLRIFPYNRVVKDLNGLSEDEFIKRIEENFEVSSEERQLSPRTIRLFLAGRWRTLTARPGIYQNASANDSLDVSLLQNYILKPLLGIDDPRTSDRIAFIGGRESEPVLEAKVKSGEYQLAFSLYPTTVTELEDIADAGQIMSPKSTWFEPKLCSGFIINRI